MRDMLNEMLMNKFIFFLLAIIGLMTAWYIISFILGMFRGVRSQSSSFFARMKLAWRRIVTFLS